MSSEPRRCPGCGKETPRPEARFCEHCGVALALAEPPPPPRDVFGDRAVRFRALEGHAKLAALLTAKPEVPELAGKTLPSLLLLAGLCVGGLLISLFTLQLCPPLFLVPLTLVVVGAVAITRNLLWSARTPLVARPALIAAVRAQLQAGAERSHSNTRHFVQLEDAHGERVELECLPSAVRMLEPGALGVAYLKGKKLAAFASVSV
ncbi:MAG: hypothetical protein EXS08_10950 [Planctomycetes bacterium]|nr:hypothetical protein [Planctomycetota bacterium]